MDFKIVRVKGFNLLLILLVAALLILIMTTSILIIYPYVHTELTITSVIGFVGLLILGFPICILLYKSNTDRTSKLLFLSIGATMISLVISGVIWYLLPVSVNSPLFIPIGMLIAVLSYLPLIITLCILYKEHHKKLDKIVKILIFYIDATFIILIAYLYISTILPNTNEGYRSLTYAIMMVFDIALISLSTANLLINIPTKHRYLFSIVFGYCVLSFIGDTLSLLSLLNMYEINSSPQLFYDIALIFLTVTMVIYVLSNIKTTTIEEINKKLEDTNLLVEDLISQSPDAMCMSDNKGIIIKANEAFLNIFGLKKTDINKAVSIFEYDFNLDQEVTSKLREARSGLMVNVECVKYHIKDEKDIFLSLKIYPTYSTDKKVAYYIFMVEDITLRKNAEEGRKVAFDQLEAKVKERTSELYILNNALQNEISEHKKDEEKIIASLKEKEVLLKEIHHRVKNNMQIISSMLGLQSTFVDNKEFNNMLKDSQNRIKSMALIHEKLYQSDNLAYVDMIEYVNCLMHNLLQSYLINTERITIVQDIDNFRFNIDMSIPLGLLINEIVSNSFKHAFPDGRNGEIFISIKKLQNNNYEMIIKDNGIGITDNKEILNSKTLGINLIMALVDQINGSIEIKNDTGFEYSIKFPTVIENMTI